MYDASCLHVVVAIDHLVHQRNGFSLSERAPARNIFREISTIAELSDDVCVVFSVVDVIDFEDVVAALKRLQDFDLGREEVAMHLVVDLLHIDDFDGHRFIWVIMVLPVTSLRPLNTWLE